MIPETKLREVLEQLLHRSRHDDVRWFSCERNFSGAGSKSYRLKLPNSSVTISYVSPMSDPDYYLLVIHNAEGEVAARKTADIDDPAVQESGWLKLLDGLFSEAHRHVTGWDKVIEEIETAVNSDAPIGEDEAKVPF